VKDVRARMLVLGSFLMACATSPSVNTGPGGAGGAAGSGGTTGSSNAGTSGAGTSGAGTSGAGTSGAIGTGGAGTTGSAGAAGIAGSGGAGGLGASGGAAGGGAGTATGGRGGSSGASGVGGASGRGGASGASGTSGAAGSAGGGGTASSGCAGKSYKLCDDFESGTVGGFPTNWTALKGYGTDGSTGIGLATGEAHSGTMALKSSSMNPGEERVQRSLASLGATATKHWGRIFYKVVSPAPRPSNGAVIHVTLAALQGTTENRVVDTVEQSNGTHQWLFNVPDDSCCTGSSYDWSFDANWHCAEWYVDVSTSSFRFFTDSSEVTSIGFTGKTAAKMSSYTALALGAIFYQAPPSPFTIWFDDLAIDDQQIGCR
jgi:hypothetical protein